jgi:hypothetical protein
VKPVATLSSAAVLSFVITTGASGQTADVGRALVVSDRLRLSADTTRSGSDFTLVKQFIVPYAGVVRVKWQLKSDGSHDAFAFVESQIDSCPVSSTTLATFETFSCKPRVVAGDLIEVTVRGEQVNIDPVAFSTGSVRRVQLFFDVVNSSGQGKTLAD